VSLSWAWDDNGHLKLGCVTFAGNPGMEVGFKAYGSYAQTLFTLNWMGDPKPYFKPFEDAKKEYATMVKEAKMSEAAEKDWQAEWGEEGLVGIVDAIVNKEDMNTEIQKAKESSEAAGEFDKELKEDFPTAEEMSGGGGGTDKKDKLKRTNSNSEVKVAEDINRQEHLNRQEHFVSEAVPTEAFVSQAVPTENKRFSEFIIQVTVAGSALVLILVGIALASSSENKTMSYKLLAENNTSEV